MKKLFIPFDLRLLDFQSVLSLPAFRVSGFVAGLPRFQILFLVLVVQTGLLALRDFGQFLKKKKDVVNGQSNQDQIIAPRQF